MARWEETPRKTQNTLEELLILSGLGLPWNLSGGAGECCWGEMCQGFPLESVASMTITTPISKWMDRRLYQSHTEVRKLVITVTKMVGRYVTNLQQPQ